MSKKLIVLLVSVIAFFAFVTYRILAPATFNDALRHIDNERYSKAIKTLNTLVKAASYEDGERMYYYRLKALMGLINELNDDYSDECREIQKAKNKTNKKTEQKLRKKIDSINADLGLDLVLNTDPVCYIFTGGKWYDEFVSLYPGSRYIEAIDFDTLQFMMKTHPATINPIMEFYRKYPDTTYLSSLVSMLLSAVSNPKIEVKGYSQQLSAMLQAFCNKYSSTAEYYRLFQCKGENVNLRDSAGTFGNITGKLDKGELVMQIERSMDSVQIGDHRDYWYRVISVSGNRGWVFGKFLQRIEPVTGAVAQNEETYTINETFNEWIDSNTPKGWQHLYAGFEHAISFNKLNNKNIVKIKTEEKGGLYKKTGSFQNLVCKVKGRLLDGNVILAAVVGYGRFAATITLEPEFVDVCGYRIPFTTLQWHEYELRSEGKMFTLYIDGDLVARKIAPQKHDLLQSSGVYVLVSQSKAHAEMEYIKIK